VAQHQAAGFSPLTNNIITDFDKKSSGTLNLKNAVENSV
jgi:hypothetical protein